MAKLAHLADLARMSEFEFETSALGRIRCGAYTMKVAYDLERILQKDGSVTGPDVARLLLQHVGHIVQDNQQTGDEEQDLPKYGLTKEQVDRISDEEVEMFAHDFLAHNAYLTKPENLDAEASAPSTEDSRSGSIEKLPNESESDYLLRAIRNYNAATIARVNRILGSFIHASQGTLEGLRKNFLISDRLSNSLTGLRRASTPTIADELSVKVPKSPAFETNRRLGHLLDFADGMRPVIIESAELIRNLNSVAIQMLSDFGRSTRRSEVFNMIIIAVAALSLVVAATFSVWSFFDARHRSAETTELAADLHEQAVELIKSQNDRVEKVSGALSREFLAASDEQRHALTTLLNSLRLEFSRLDRSIKQQQVELEKISKSVAGAAKALRVRPGVEGTAAPD